MRRIAKFLAITVPAAMIGGLVFLYYFQAYLLYFPSSQEFTDCPQMNGLKAQTIVAEQNGQKIRLYFQETENAIATLLIFHGNGGSACDRFPYVEELQKYNINVAVAEYPGYSNDASHPSETSILNNAAAVYEYLEANNSKNLKIFLYGESLGTAVATKIASENKIAGLILQSPFTSVRDLAKIHYSKLPIDAVLRDTFDAETWAQLVMVKTLVFLGDKDTVVPLEIGKKQAANFVKLVDAHVFHGHGHNDLHSEALWESTAKFITQISAEE